MRRCVLVVTACLAAGCAYRNELPTNRANVVSPTDADTDVDDSGVDEPFPGFDVSSDDPGYESFVYQDLALDPPNATVVIDTATSPATTATLAYRATLIFSTGGLKDVTSEVVLWLDDTSLGTFSGNTFTTTDDIGKRFAATTTVYGSAESADGVAGLTLLQLRASGEHRDYFFFAPYFSPPTPDRAVLMTVVGKGPVDVGTVVTNPTDPVNPVGSDGKIIDATALIVPRAMSEGDAASGCLARSTSDTNGDGVDDTFTAVAGEPVCFEIAPGENESIVPYAQALFYAVFVDVVATGLVLDHRVVLLSTPPKDVGGPK